MFSGIVENRGKVIKKEKKGGQIRFRFRFERPEKKVKAGDSIAISGVCLTASRLGPGWFEADVVDETLKATTLGSLQIGSLVNLERSLRYGDFVGGHFVSGHVDGVGTIASIKRTGKNELWSFSAPKEIMAYVAKKGSIAIDGISLTIQKVAKSSFSIALIPHTLDRTTLGGKKKGDKVNLEVDLLARYLALPVHRKVTAGKKSSLGRQIAQLSFRGF